MKGVIDIHPHVISPETQRYPRAPLGGRASDWSQTRPVNAQQMIAAMNSAGIDKAVLVQASTCYGHDNSYLADAVAADRRRFIGVFSVDVLAPDAPQRIRYWMERGLAGLRVFIAGHTTAQDVRLDDPRAFAAWEYASGAGLPICVQLRAPALGQLQHMLERFPRARRSSSRNRAPLRRGAGAISLRRQGSGRRVAARDDEYREAQSVPLRLSLQQWI